MKINKMMISLLAAGVIATPLAHATDGYFAHGYGMKSVGMGGVGIALPQDSLAAATNPAGMVLVGNRADLGATLFRPSRSAEITGNGFGADGNYDGNGKDIFLIPEFGYNHMIRPDMSLGVSVFGNGGMNTQYERNPFAAFGGVGNAGVKLEQLFISPTWAMKLNDKHAIGVAVNFVYQTFSANGLQPFQGISSNPAALSNNGKDSSTGVGLRLGWTGELNSVVTMGATYQPKTKMSKFDSYAGLFAEQGGFDIPATYGVGIAIKAMPDTTFAADIQKIDYSDVASVGNPFFFPPGPGQTLGGPNGSGFGLKDVTVLKLGVSHVMNDKLTVRAGYNHTTQPIQDSQTFFNILAPGVVQDHLTLGATWNVTKQNELTFAYMHAFEETVNGSGSIPPGPPPGFGGGNANLRMFQDSLGIAYSWKM